MGWGSKWFQAPKEPRPERRGPFTIFKDAAMRKRRTAEIYRNRAYLEVAAEQLRLCSDPYCLHAATLVDAAIESLDEGLVNLAKDKPGDRAKFPRGDGEYDSD